MSVESASTKVDRVTLQRTHYALQKNCFLSECEELPEGILAFSATSVSPLWNHAAWIGGSDGNFASFLAKVDSWHRDKRRPVVYLTDPEVERLDLLYAKDYERFDEEAWLTSTSNGKLSPRVTQVTTLDEYLHVFAGAFSTSDPGYEAALQQAARSGHRHFVLHDERRAVSVGTFALIGGTGCLYNIGTLPSARNRGFATEMVHHLLAYGRAQGSKTIFLQVERGGSANRLYQRVGFELAFIRVGFRSKRWAGAEQRQTLLSKTFQQPVPPVLHRSIQRETRPISGRPLGKEQVFSAQQLFIGAWTYLLHRYIGLEAVDLWIAHESSPLQKLSVLVSSREKCDHWLSTLPVHGEAGNYPDAETVLCLGSRSLQDDSIPLQAQVSEEQVQIIYREDLFSKDVIRRMIGHYVTILQSILTSPTVEVKDIEVLTDSERRQLLIDWNESRFEASETMITRAFEEQVERTPEAVALSLIGDVGERAQLTYRQLNRKANRLAHRLQELGVGADVAVGILLERSLDYIVSILAVLKAGGVFVPLDAASPLERISYILSDVGARIVITDSQHKGKSVLPRSAIPLCIEDGLDHLPHKNLAKTIRPQSAAYIIYTSGSTGNPKGVVIPHQALADHSLDCRKTYGINSKDRILQFSPFYFDASLEQIFPALVSGAALFVRGSNVWTPFQFNEILEREQLTVLDLPTAYWHTLVDFWDTTPDAAPHHCVRLVIVGGETLSPQKVEKWQRSPLAKARLINAYGPTEATITSISFEITPSLPTAFGMTVPIGRPRASRRVYVLDDLGRPAPIGIPGELHIGGPFLARRYHNQPELTAKHFIPDPFSDDPEARLYKTGDLVRYSDDGTLEFLGRLDDQVKVRGFRIELGEIEACLRKHPAVRDVLVVARVAGDGEKRIIAYTIATSAEANATDLSRFVRTKLPEYMVPASILLLEKWPLLTNGKIDRGALPNPIAAQPDAASLRGPRDPLELQLQLLFERVLKQAPIGIDRSFFELGGDSLQALELLVKIEKETGRQLPLGTLYQASTVEAVARELRGEVAPEQWSSLVPLQARGQHPPLYLLHTTPGDILGYGNLVYRLGPDRACYGFQSLGLKNAHLSHITIEEMARYYVDLLRRFQPHGPYYLGGWCYGGIIAVEMARVLKALGEVIGLLALLETVAMPARLSNYCYYVHRARCFLKMTPAGWLAYARGKMRYRRNARLASRMRFQEVNQESDDARDIRLAQLEHVYNTNLIALNRYRSSYYDGTVTLFNAAERDAALIPDPQYGWVGLAREIEIYEVPGSHDTMLAEPNVAVLAGQLNGALQRAQERTTRP